MGIGPLNRLWDLNLQAVCIILSAKTPAKGDPHVIQHRRLSDSQTEAIASRLEAFDEKHITYKPNGQASIGEQVGHYANGIDGFLECFFFKHGFAWGSCLP